MSKLAASATRRWRPLGLATGLILLALILAKPTAHWFDDQALVSLARGDQQSNPDRAIVWYQVADSLSPHNQAVITKLAATQAERGDEQAAAQTYLSYPTQSNLEAASHWLLVDNPDKALKIAKKVKQRGSGIAKAQALMELGRYDDAMVVAKADNDTKTQDLIAVLKTSQSAGELNKRGQDYLVLAQKLYLNGLLRSSKRLLQDHPVANSQSDLLMAQIAIRLGQDSPASLREGRGWLDKGIVLSPERTDLRQLLQQIDQKLGDSKAAAEQGSKIKALQEGKV